MFLRVLSKLKADCLWSVDILFVSFSLYPILFLPLSPSHPARWGEKRVTREKARGGGEGVAQELERL